MANKLFSSRKSFWLLLAVVIICSLTAGVAGEIFTRVYIIKDWSLPFLSGEVNISDLNSSNYGLVIRDPKKVVVNQDVQLAETLSGIQPVLVNIFKAASETSVNSAQPDFYKLDQPVFTGLIMTADGWVIAPVPANLKTDFKVRNYVAITNDRRLYKIDQIATIKNIPSDLLIFHLAGASNLPVKKIVPRSELSLGQSLLVVEGTRSVWPTTITSLAKSSAAVLSSDTVNASLTLAGVNDNNWRNSLAFDLAGNLVAVIDNSQNITPAFTYGSLWSSLLQPNQPGRPFLGVNYLDLSKVKLTVNNLDKGAWLYPSADQPAVLKNSPAQAAGLKAGDIITWVNNQEINATNDLAEVLSTYKAGDKITITYISAGQEKEVDVKLGELK